MANKGILIVVSGFAGTGKGTIMKKLVSEYDNYALSVSMTTRAPRPGETNGIEYFFTTKEEFEKKIAEGGFVEYANYVGNYYGTPKSYVDEKLAQGKDVILEIEIQGAMKIKERFPEALLIYVLPPSVAELKRRLITRGTETMDVIERRMLRACEESKGIGEYEYIVVNDDLEECTKRVHGIIAAAHCTPFRNQDFIDEIRKELDEMKGDC